MKGAQLKWRFCCYQAEKERLISEAYILFGSFPSQSDHKSAEAKQCCYIPIGQHFWQGKWEGFRPFSGNIIKLHSHLYFTCVNNLCVSLQSHHSSMRQKSVDIFKRLPRVFKVQTIRSATWALTRVGAVSTLLQRGENLRRLVGFPPVLLMRPV